MGARRHPKDRALTARDLERPTPASKRVLAQLFESILTTATADPDIERAMFQAMSDSLRGHAELMIMLLEAKGVPLPGTRTEGQSRGRQTAPARDGSNDVWLRRQLGTLGQGGGA
jgi:hypothetical protein